jgi:DNA-binding MarR family transcriptional regulator
LPSTSAHIDPKKLLAYRILSLSSLLNRGIEHVLEAEVDITVRQWRVLLCLCTQGAASVQRIADFCRYDKSQVSRAVVQLEVRGLVMVRSHVHDRRSVEVSVSEEGQAVYDRALPLSTSRQARLTSCLSAKDIKDLDRLLDVLTQQAELLLDEAHPPRGKAR